MKPTNNKSISPLQLTFFIVQTQIGVGVLSLPYAVHTGGAGSDAWISVLLTGIIIQFLIFLFSKIGSRYPNCSLYDMFPITFGKYLGKFIILLYVVYFMLVAGLILILFNYIIEVWAFPRTPNWAFMIILASATYYLVVEKVRVIARFYTIVSILLISIIVLSLPVYTHFDIRYIMPIGQSGLLNIILGTKEAMLSLLGFEVFLFLFPFVEGSPKEKVVSASIANIIVTCYYTYLTFISLIFFSPEEFKLVPQPVLYLLNAFTYTVLERIDIVFLAIWMISVMTSLMTYIYLASVGLSNISSTEEHRKMVPLAIGCSIIIGLIPRNILSIERWSSTIGNLGMIFAIAIPILVFLSSFFVPKRKIEERM
ncbi:MAG: spore germination protein [Bacillaceae bacterium]|nr:spore germination protein [Bacillaceae bacterium]